MAEIKECVSIAKNAIEEKKGSDVKVLNISKISPLADYFVLATGNNINQLHAMADEVTEKLYEVGVHPKQTEGYNTGNWILIDYGDFMIHLFSPESREYYNIDRIWKDAVSE